MPRGRSRMLSGDCTGAMPAALASLKKLGIRAEAWPNKAGVYHLRSRRVADSTGREIPAAELRDYAETPGAFRESTIPAGMRATGFRLVRHPASLSGWLEFSDEPTGCGARLSVTFNGGVSLFWLAAPVDADNWSLESNGRLEEKYLDAMAVGR